MSIDYYSIGLRIKDARIKKNLSQEDLAELINISRTMVAYLENGTKGISLETLINIANALEVSADFLLVDQLLYQSTKDTDASYILLDCTKQEEQIITKNMNALKKILKEFIIK